MEGRLLRERGRTPWRWIGLGLLAACAAAVLGPGVLSHSAGSTPTLVACDRPEAVTILLDDSPSVIDLDRTDQRGGAVRRVLSSLAAEPCTGDDVVAVVSFADDQVVTGPAPAADLAHLRRAGGRSTDIAAAARVADELTHARADARQLIVLVSDLQEGSGTPIDATFERLLGITDDVIVVSIGEVDVGAGVSEIALRTGDDIAARIVERLNHDRRNR
ncbi:MAG: vWA domain-containing protein [Actinomycetota bacterium]